MSDLIGRQEFTDGAGRLVVNIWCRSADPCIGRVEFRTTNRDVARAAADALTSWHDATCHTPAIESTPAPDANPRGVQHDDDRSTRPGVEARRPRGNTRRR